jgi:pilus assembly protein CpaE
VRRRPLRSLTKVAAFTACERGVAAVEFALFAPMLFLSLVTAADLGLALYDRMALDHVLRAGALPAMADMGESSVLTTIKASANKQFAVCSSSSAPAGQFCPTVTVTCRCPDGSAPACTTPVATCPSTYEKLYILSATKSRNNMLLPAFNFSSSLQVQVR